MFAVIQSRGRQVKVTPGVSVLVDGRLAEPGAELTLEEVLLVEKDGGEVLTARRSSPTPKSSRWSRAKRAGRRSASSRKSAARACAGPGDTGRCTRACASKTFWCSNGP